mmetsp:Transcript_11351/g.26419  ORF Transcript_11351/g.26419 Transcript_11351/m.26419 type:complete len:220 (+) Transcript_11351:184-843(+)
MWAAVVLGRGLEKPLLSEALHLVGVGCQGAGGERAVHQRGGDLALQVLKDEFGHLHDARLLLAHLEQGRVVVVPPIHPLDGGVLFVLRRADAHEDAAILPLVNGVLPTVVPCPHPRRLDLAVLDVSVWQGLGVDPLLEPGQVLGVQQVVEEELRCGPLELPVPPQHVVVVAALVRPERYPHLEAVLSVLLGPVVLDLPPMGVSFSNLLLGQPLELVPLR